MNLSEFVEGPRYRDGSCHYINEYTLQVVSSSLFTGAACTSGFKNRIVSDHFAAKNLLEFPRYRESFNQTFPNTVENIEKCRRIQGFYYVNNVTKDVYVCDIFKNEWSLLEDFEKLTFVQREHFELDDVREARRKKEWEEADRLRKERQKRFEEHMRDCYYFKDESMLFIPEILTDSFLEEHYFPSPEDRRLRDELKKHFNKQTETGVEGKLHNGYYHFKIPRLADVITEVSIPRSAKRCWLDIGGQQEELERDIESGLFEPNLVLPLLNMQYNDVKIVCECDKYDMRFPVLGVKGDNIVSEQLRKFVKRCTLRVPFQNKFILIGQGMGRFTD